MSTDTQQLTLNAITKNACDILCLWQPDLMDMRNTSAKQTERRYMVFGLMEKHGYTHQQIADHFKVTRETVTKGLSKLDDWLRIYKDLAGTYQRLNTLALNTL